MHEQEPLKGLTEAVKWSMCLHRILHYSGSPLVASLGFAQHLIVVLHLQAAASFIQFFLGIIFSIKHFFRKKDQNLPQASYSPT